MTTYILYEGPSMLNGKPIVALVSGIGRPSENAKTGPMAQVWYPPVNSTPLDSLRSGEDQSVCGTCKLRGDGTGKGRSCYPVLMHGPQALFRLHQAGNVQSIKNPKLLWRNQRIRFGAYGDPASAPTETLVTVSRLSDGHTGYTHQWRTCDPELKRYLMASCDSEQDYHEAKEAGWRTFRIKRPDDPKLNGEHLCPASHEAGRVLNCFFCLRCRGGTAKDTVVNVHGNGKKHF